MGDCERRGPHNGESDAEAERRTRRRAKKNAKRGNEPAAGKNTGLPWKQWYTTWSQTGRPYEEFWDLSPAQVAAVFEGMGYMKQKAGTSDIMQFAKSLGLATG